MKDYYINEVGDIADLYKRLINYADLRHSKNLAFERLLITVKKMPKNKQRTSPQLRLYWVVIGEVKKAFTAKGYDYTKEQIHEFFKSDNDLFDEEVLDNGTIIRIPKSLGGSGSIDTKELTEHIEYIKAWTIKNLNYYIED